VRSGNQDVVALFLAAGVSPNAEVGGETAVAVAAQAGRKEVVRALLDAGADPLPLVDGLHARHGRKDGWERLASLSGVFTFVSSLLIAGVVLHQCLQRAPARVE
jgi:ankyrin repeat protein